MDNLITVSKKHPLVMLLETLLVGILATFLNQVILDTFNFYNFQPIHITSTIIFDPSVLGFLSFIIGPLFAFYYLRYLHLYGPLQYSSFELDDITRTIGKFFCILYILIFLFGTFFFTFFFSFQELAGFMYSMGYLIVTIIYVVIIVLCQIARDFKHL